MLITGSRPSTPTPKLILSSAEEGGANDLRPVIYLHKESAVRRNQDTENDHHNMERDSFQNIWKQQSFKKKFQNIGLRRDLEGAFLYKTFFW